MKNPTLVFHPIRIATAAFALCIAQFAFAHAHPKVQTPAPDTTLASAPADVSIAFDDAVEPAFSSIDVTDAQGSSVVDDKSTVDPSNHKLVKAALTHLAPGRYTVKWTAVARDSHRTEGRYTFTVK
jgi:methionine-rich copper-binding protein CopC